MPFNAILLMLGITENYGIDVANMVIALWFFSVGYLLYKRASRALIQRRAKGSMNVVQIDVPCLDAVGSRQ
jgi:hypothetical protein